MLLLLRFYGLTDAPECLPGDNDVASGILKRAGEEGFRTEGRVVAFSLPAMKERERVAD